MKDQAESLRSLIESSKKENSTGIVTIINNKNIRTSLFAEALAAYLSGNYDDTLLVDLSSYSYSRRRRIASHIEVVNRKEILELLTREDSNKILNYLNSYEHIIINYICDDIDNLWTVKNITSEIVLVIEGREDGIIEGYSLIKSLYMEKNIERFNIAISNVSSIEQGEKIFENILETTDKFLDVELNKIGFMGKGDIHLFTENLENFKIAY